MVLSAITRYTALVGRRPYMMGMCTTGLLAFIGDIISQNIEFRFENYSNQATNMIDNNIINKHNFEWNYLRSMKFGFIGLTYGPQIAFWYITLTTKIFPARGGKESLTLALKRMCLDQTIFAGYSLYYWFSMTTLLEPNGSYEQIPDKMRASFMPAYINNLKLWPPAQMINFWLIPPEFRVIFANFVSLIWNSYISYESHKNVENA